MPSPAPAAYQVDPTRKSILPIKIHSCITMDKWAELGKPEKGSAR